MKDVKDVKDIPVYVPPTDEDMRIIIDEMRKAPIYVKDMCKEFIRHFHTDMGIKYCNVMSTYGNAHGMIQLDPENCYIASVSVSDKSRRQGYGRAVMQEIEHIALEHGIEYTTLMVRQGSTTQKWYRKMGYEEYSKEKETADDGTALVWMRKELPYMQQP